MTSSSFDFGRNWEAFSTAKLDIQRLSAATHSLQELIGADKLEGRTFLDVGCGSGLFCLAAAQCGAARVVGFDVNPTAIEVTKNNVRHFSDQLDADATPELHVGNVLDTTFLSKLGSFDIVYAWGSLHHTGTMWQAIRNATSRVKRGSGILVLSIYNHHWTSPVWKQIKRVYNQAPALLQRLMCYSLAVPIFIAKLAVTRSNPLRKQRGMSFWYDVIDWVGGYPYEYATPDEVIAAVESLGFNTQRVIPAEVPTGCNEYVFEHGL